METPRERRPRSRFEQALLCPYCRDAVARRGTVACARRGCGALYHRDCWEEVAASYGGCAIYGCESAKSREVSAAGWVVRLARLVVASLFVPPRLVQRFARVVQEDEPDDAKVLTYTMLGVGAVIASVLVLPAGLPCIVVVLPVVMVAWLGWVVKTLARWIGHTLTGELAALARADDPEDTVLGRLRRAASEKK